MNILRTADKAAFGIVLTGAIYSAVSGAAQPKPSRNPFAQKPDRPRGIQLYSSIIAVASAYKLLRTFGIKTQDEKRLIKAAYIYDQARIYKQRARIYRRAAEVILKRRFKSLSTAAS